MHSYSLLFSSLPFRSNGVLFSHNEFRSRMGQSLNGKTQWSELKAPPLTKSPTFEWAFPGHFHHVKRCLRGTCRIDHCELFSALLIHQLHHLGRFIHTTTISETLCWALKILTPWSGHTPSLVSQSSESHPSSGMQTFLFKLVKVNHVRFSPLWQPNGIFLQLNSAIIFKWKIKPCLKTECSQKYGEF